jgi:uncharacterized membrane protein
MANNSMGGDGFRAMVNRALERPLLVIGVIVVITALLMYAFGWWPLILGIVAIALVLYASPRAMQDTRRMFSGAPAQTGAPSIDLNRLEGKYRQSMERALGTRSNIERAIAETQDPGMKLALTDATRQLDEMTQNIYGLAFKAQSIQNSLQASSSMKALSEEIERLNEQANSTNDEFQKSQYLSSLDGKLQQMQNLTDTTVALNRWEAQMDNAISTMETILSQVLRIKSSEVLSYTGATDDLSQRLRQEIESLKATSDAMDSVYGMSK